MSPESPKRLAYPGIALVGAYVRQPGVTYRDSAPTSVDVEHVRCPFAEMEELT